MEDAEDNRVKQTLVLLAEKACEEGLDEFLLIGGNAVIAHGVPRFTRDVDFVVPESSRTTWRLFLERLGFPFFHGTSAFEQYKDPADVRPRVDLMIVDEPTWGKLRSDAWDFDLGNGLNTKVASPQHIIAMKLKACLAEHRREDAVDWSDIVELVMIHQFDPESDANFSDFVLHFGGEMLHRKLIDEIAERRKRG